MKKLLITAIGAAAALGAFADNNPVSTTGGVVFEAMGIGATTISALNTNADGTYWGAGEAASNNTYAIETASSLGTIPGGLTHPAFVGEATYSKALSIKTTFGNELELYAKGDDGASTTNINNGLYFDSLVKFTVCEEVPDQEYSGAKIVMWLQEEYDGSDNILGTNLMVRAGYLSYAADAVAVSNATYKCESVDGDFADKWHRVTIKSIANITTAAANAVPGFVVFIDEEPKSRANPDEKSLDSTFTAQYTLNESASEFDRQALLFPSLVQSGGDKTSIKAVGFDGTGAVNELTFTAEPPEFAKDLETPKASVVDNADHPISGSPFTSLEDAVDAVNDLGSGTYTFTLSKGMVLEAPLEFNNTSANIILDFNGFVLTNESNSAAAISNAGNLTITNSTGNVGGIYCAGAGAAVSQASTGALVIGGGVFNGDVDFAEALVVTVLGGSFKNDETYFETEETASGTWIVDGKKLQQNQTTGLYDVVDIVYATITFDKNGGEGTMAAMTVEDGVETNLAANAFTRAGYTFAGWSTEALGQVEYADEAQITTDGNITLYAKWNANSYTITFTYGLDHSSSTTANYAYGETPTAPDVLIAVPGYNASWPTFSPVTEATTYAAVYEAETYTITFDSNGGSAVADVTFAVTNTAFDLPIPTLADNTFAGWTNETYTAAFTNFNPQTTYASFKLYAKWEPNQTVPSINPAEGGSGEADCGSAEAAAAARDAINANKATYITKPSTVSDTTTYYSYVEAKVVDTTKVAVELSAAGETAALTSANADVATLPVANAAAGNTTANVSSIAGLYYSIVSGATPSTVTTEGARVLGDGGTIQLALPKVGTAGFYKVKVSATDK